MAKKDKEIEKPKEDLRIPEKNPKFKDVLSSLVNKPNKPKK
ncbi:hypothetical protein PQ462_12650 [Flavobacterium sp. KACC 22758]|nr:hypothetical protein [Flavobacterium sp. KACC 22758]WDF57566.1 hypothetical protein PQ462_12650 [Flavobacterium sp. KACC 22758]